MNETLYFNGNIKSENAGTLSIMEIEKAIKFYRFKKKQRHETE